MIIVSNHRMAGCWHIYLNFDFFPTAETIIAFHGRGSGDF